MKSFIKMALVSIAAVIMVGCARAPSNAHVISTEDCGVNWTKVNTGDAVPKHTGQVCGYNMAIPNWPMSGEANFKTPFSGGVLTRATLSYTYNIVDPLKFIKEAAYLGKMGGDLEISAESIGNKYEMAENVIMDKALRKITTDITEKLMIIDATPDAIEDEIFKQISEVLAAKGVVISDLALVLDPDDQTRLAIDVTTAMRVYDKAGYLDVGKAIAVARAGATKVSVNNNPDKKQDD